MEEQNCIRNVFLHRWSKIWFDYFQWLSTALASLSESGTYFPICLLSSTIPAGFRLCSCSWGLISKSTHRWLSGSRSWFLLDKCTFSMLQMTRDWNTADSAARRCRLLSWGRVFEFEVIVVGYFGDNLITDGWILEISILACLDEFP